MYLAWLMGDRIFCRWRWLHPTLQSRHLESSIKRSPSNSLRIRGPKLDNYPSRRTTTRSRAYDERPGFVASCRCRARFSHRWRSSHIHSATTIIGYRVFHSSLFLLRSASRCTTVQRLLPATRHVPRLLFGPFRSSRIFCSRVLIH